MPMTVAEEARQRSIDWEKMSNEQRIDFLYSWCVNLEGRLNGQARGFRNLLNRVVQAEEKFANKTSDSA